MRLPRRRTDDRGAGLVEYALGLSLFALVLVVSVDALKDSQNDHLSASGDRIGMPDLDASPTTSTTSTTVPSGDDGDDTDTGDVTVVLDPPPSGTATRDNKNAWTATVTITAQSGGTPLEGVVIGGSWAPGGEDEETSCTTGADGTCDLARWELGTLDSNKYDPDPTATLTIESISGSGYVPGDGQVGTSVTVDAPEV
ncbi:MAG: Flp family type IVb pilin [Acidimicrobiales bacterium]